MTNLAVVGEAMHMLAFSLDAQTELLQWVERGGVTLIPADNADLQRARELMVKCSDRPMDFADALIVAACERLRIHRVASIDMDFRVYRLPGRKWFQNVLDECV